ncbi:ammonium transporter [Nonomuraea soli]|nr:ammonium transporter [Nonomuraea soli]
MIDGGTTTWMLVCTALVLLMTPGLALFYGGMTRAKSVLNMMMMSFASIIVVTIAWVIYGFSLFFDPAGDGSGIVNKLVGGLDYLGLTGVFNAVYENLIVEDAAKQITAEAAAADNFPLMVFSAFQLTFAIITVALISGAIADRAKFGAWVLFAGVWVTLVYFPVAHWVWGGGWLGQLGIEDFAGGTVVHINAGAAALALALVLGKRKGWGKEPMRPHNLTLVLLGTGILWFGWFGFNAGSELAPDQTAGLAFMNTQIATAVAAGTWIVVEKLRDKHSTTLGVASGAVAGLVAITPACGFVDPWAAAVIGLLAGAACCYAVGWKNKLGYDDSLDVVGVHLVGGVVGAVSLGFVANYPFLPGQNKGVLMEGGQWSQVGLQILGPVAVGLYSFVVSWVLGKIIDKTMGFRISEEAEVAGIDITSHAETGYDLGSVHASGVISSNGPVSTVKKVDA